MYSCKYLHSLVYKDNMFNEHEHDQSEQVQDMKMTQHRHLLRLFPMLDRINLEAVDNLLSCEVVKGRQR